MSAQAPANPHPVRCRPGFHRVETLDSSGALVCTICGEIFERIVVLTFENLQFVDGSLEKK